MPTAPDRRHRSPRRSRRSKSSASRAVVVRPRDEEERLPLPAELRLDRPLDVPDFAVREADRFDARVEPGPGGSEQRPASRTTEKTAITTPPLLSTSRSTHPVGIPPGRPAAIRDPGTPRKQRQERTQHEKRGSQAEQDAEPRHHAEFMETPETGHDHGKEGDRARRRAAEERFPRIGEGGLQRLQRRPSPAQLSIEPVVREDHVIDVQSDQHRGDDAGHDVQPPVQQVGEQKGPREGGEQRQDENAQHGQGRTKRKENKKQHEDERGGEGDDHVAPDHGGRFRRIRIPAGEPHPDRILPSLRGGYPGRDSRHFPVQVPATKETSRADPFGRAITRANVRPASM